MRKINIGDTVETIDDNISGVVTKISGTLITFEDPDGFEFQYETSALMASSSMDQLETAVYNADMESVKREKHIKKNKIGQKVKPKERQAPQMVVDLHIHHLTESIKGMTNFDMLNLQVDTARQQLEFAIRKRIPKMVFVHGVGEGVLKQELETLFGRYNNVTHYDADYKTYGLGATEIKIFQNLEP